ncbi:MAG: AAA family ATPase [Sphingobacteriaceae bacterium]|nr:AAA family ATPase [Sphingobacteriaceae bacterium]
MSSASTDRLSRLKQLLQIERDEDYKIYKEQFLKASIEARRKNGLTWYPIKINETELGYGDLLQVDIERTSHINMPHQFSVGKSISLFSNASDEGNEVSGVIKAIHRNVIKIIFPYEELPDWAYDGKLGINAQFDENSYKEMDKALDVVINARNNRVEELRDILEGKQEPSFGKEKLANPITHLNPSQNKAVEFILNVKDFGVVHGPPGTGKTTTLVEAIRLTLQTEKQVLVCAPTNTAVDLLSEKLNNLGLNVMRLGHPARISEDLLSTSVDGKLTASPFYKDIKNLRKNAEEYFRMAGKYKRVFGKEEAQQRTAYYTEAKNCLKEARLLEDYIVENLFKEAHVICCTPVTSTNRMMSKKSFDTLFFDEASQALEPMVWVPLLKCKRLILCGDHCQLPPVVKSKKAASEGLGITLLDRCIKKKEAVVLLDKQYRMHEAIMAFSNLTFYENKLVADNSVAKAKLINDENDVCNRTIEFVDTAGCGFNEVQNPESLSFSNKQEGDLLFKHLKLVLESYAQYKEADKISVGIISPYKEQVEWMKEEHTSYEMNLEKVNHFSIKTIDGFQGEERDIIYISLVRSNDNQEIGFLSDLRRMNVALTRAKKKLVVIGDSATIGSNPFYKQFIEYCEEKGFYKSAWEYQEY